MHAQTSLLRADAETKCRVASSLGTYPKLLLLLLSKPLLLQAVPGVVRLQAMQQCIALTMHAYAHRSKAVLIFKNYKNQYHIFYTTHP